MSLNIFMMPLITDIKKYFLLSIWPYLCKAAGKGIIHKWDHRYVRIKNFLKGIYSCFFLIHLRNESLEI